jgi:drug/metabolite transporter (DMT)-like permease
VSGAPSRRAVVGMLLGTGAFAVNDIFLKIVAEELPATQILCLRSLLATFLLGTLAVALGQARSLAAAGRPLVLVRGTMELFCAVLFVSAILFVPIGNLTAIAQMAPLIITLLGALVLGEIVGWRRWSAVAMGLAGGILIAGPAEGGVNLYTLLALGVPVMVAVRDLIARRIGTDIGVLPMTFSLSAVVAAGTFFGVLLGDWRMPSGAALAMIGAACLLALFGHAAVLTAVRESDLSSIAPLYYVQTVWAGIAGLAVFGEVPGLAAIAGIALVVGAGLYTLRRQRLHQQVETPPPVVA